MRRRDFTKYLALAATAPSLACGDDAGVGQTADSGPLVDSDGAPTCEPRTGSQTEGPFYPGEPMTQMNIVGDRQGVALVLRLTCLSAEDCSPLANAEVDVWSADAVGDYSGYADFETEGQDWLRGQQTTNASGQVEFVTIVPGSYPGRAVHLHVKVRADGLRELTTQVYLPDSVVAEVLGNEHYADGAGQTINTTDAFYAMDTLMTASGTVSDGFTTSHELRV